MSLPTIEEIDFLRSPSSDNSTISIATAALSKGIRVDGRKLNQCRNIDIEFLSTPGSVIVSFGNTIVCVTVSGEILSPSLEKPNEGTLSFNIEMTPMCSSSYEPNKSTEQEKIICYTIERVFKDSGALDVESLCIIAGIYVWCIRIKIHVLQDDGNLLDVCCVATLLGLRSFKRPETIAINERTETIQLDINYLAPLSIYHSPILISVGVLGDSDHYVVDTTKFEGNAIETYIHMLFNQFGDLFFLHKNGGDALGLETFNKAIEIGRKVAVDIYAKIMAQVNKLSKAGTDIIRLRRQHYKDPTTNIMKKAC